jgi:starch phosphorylase
MAEKTAATTTQIKVEDDRTGMSPETLKRAIKDHLFYTQGVFPEIATTNDWYMALAHTVRDRLMRHWIVTTEKYFKSDARVVCYLSAEFLLGPHLVNNLINLDIFNKIKAAAESLSLDFNALVEEEEEPGLGNGGLGRLAACYMDSLATLQIPAIGYGIRYEFGIFDQVITDGWQVEITDKWLHYGNPWEVARPEITLEVKFGGHTEQYHDEQGNFRVRWVPAQVVNGVPYDTPILGYKMGTANTLRLWKAEAPESFDFHAFNVGDYVGSVQQKMASETISKVLYPNDEPIQGKRLRLEQQYFFVSCSLQDLFRLHCIEHESVEGFSSRTVVQLNDTHPSISVAELMRLLMDEHGLGWDQAWAETSKTFNYTNHTLMPEALERWPLSLFGELLPRHLEIIYEINKRFLDQVRAKFPGDEDRLRRMSIIDESGERFVRMAHLAAVGSERINGVAELHTELLKKSVLKDFYEMWPEKFLNVTNGVTPRRFILVSNPKLADLITDKIGENWVLHLEELKELEQFVNDKEFRSQWREIKKAAKLDLAERIKNLTGIVVDHNSLFDIQVKRMHEYKRQHLNVLNVITLYNRIKKNPKAEVTPRTVIFGGKAAPGYYMAKLIIKLINSVGEVVNNDKDVAGRLKVVFLPDFNVKMAHHVYPAADLSEQISTAGTEASGTGNMKFSLNGALTMGTLDGANIEIREQVGAENFFLFGLTEQQIEQVRAQGYKPWEYVQKDAELQEAIAKIADGTFSNGDTELFSPLLDVLMHKDPYMLCADYRSYVDCQQQVDIAYRDADGWSKKSILNVARMGKFSSDRAIREYCQGIWHVDPIEVTLDDDED